MNFAALSLDTLRLEQRGRVVIARVDDPPFSYMTQRMQRDLDAPSEAVEGDRSAQRKRESRTQRRATT